MVYPQRSRTIKRVRRILLLLYSFENDESQPPRPWYDDKSKIPKKPGVKELR
jgi:hypothetical protein